MNNSILLALGVGTLTVVGTNLFRKAKPRPVTVLVYDAPRAGYTHLQLFLPHVISFLAMNGLGLTATLLAAAMVEYHWPWWLAPVFFFGWLIVWGFGINRLVYPDAYLKWLSRQKKITEVGFVFHGLAALFWLIVFGVASLSGLRVN
jgi:hypothetical protein